MTAKARLLLAAICGLTVGVAMLATSVTQTFADINYDWLVVKGALYGDAHGDLEALGEEFGGRVTSAVPHEDGSTAHPRIPGSIVLTLPLTLVPFSWLLPLATAITVGFVVYMILPTLSGLRRPQVWGAAIFCAITIPLLTTVWFGAQRAWVAVMTLAGWAYVVSGKQKLGGGLIGAAAALKVFPFLLIVPLLIQRQRKAAVVVVATVVGLNLAGLLLPGVTLAGSIETLLRASEGWVELPGNASLMALMVGLGLTPLLALTAVVVLIVGLVWVLATSFRARSMRDPLPWLLLGLLAIPISWVHYDVVLLPAVVALLVARQPRSQLVAMILPALWLIPSILFMFGAGHPGNWFLVSRMVLLGVWMSGALDWESAGSDFKWAVKPTASEGIPSRPSALRLQGTAGDEYV